MDFVATKIMNIKLYLRSLKHPTISYCWDFPIRLWGKGRVHLGLIIRAITGLTHRNLHRMSLFLMHKYNYLYISVCLLDGERGYWVPRGLLWFHVVAEPNKAGRVTVCGKETGLEGNLRGPRDRLSSPEQTLSNWQEARVVFRQLQAIHHEYLGRER